MANSKIEDLLQQQSSGELNKNEALLSELFGQQQKKPKKSPPVEVKSAEQSDQEEANSDDKPSSTNLTDILQMMQKEQKQNGSNADLSGDEERFDEEDEESLSEEEKFAAMLNNSAQLQQLLLSSTGASTNNTQPSTSANSKILNLYEELIGQQQQQQQSLKERNEQNFSPSSSQLDDQPEAELSDYERFSRAVQQQQLLQQLQHDKLAGKLVQQQPARKRTNAIYTKLYQCNVCEYNTRWLSNLYAHEKRRHNTCSSSQGNLKVITIKRDVPSPSSSTTVLNSSPFRASAQMNLSSLLNGLEGSGSKLLSNQPPSNRLDSELMNQLNDFNNNQKLSNSFVSQLLQSNDSAKVTRPLKERTASGDRKYTCSICQRTYCHKHSLQRHLVCHRESGNASQANKLSSQDNQTAGAIVSPNFKHEPQSSPIANDLNSCGNLFTQPSNGTSTPFNTSGSTGRSSVDSVISGEHNLKQQQNNQLANQMFGGLNQEMLESLISGSNSSLLGNLITGSTNSVHSPNNSTTTYSNATANDSTTTPPSNSTALFSV